MTVKTRSARARALPYARFRDQLDRQIAAGLAREEARYGGPAVIDNNGVPQYAGQARVINGAPTYRDPGTSERYTVGYGGERNYPVAPARDYTPSLAQIKFLNDLLVSREHTYTEAEIAEGRSDWRKIKPMIDELKVSARRDFRARQTQVAETPAAAAPASSGRLDFSAIPDGNYALPGEGDKIHFYRVSTGRNGFKKVQNRASDELWPTTPKQGIAILHKIVAFGTEESLMLFATKLERCYTCYRSLTDATSRACGQGPECRSK